MLEQAFNVSSLYGFGGFEFLSAREKDAEMKWEYDQLVAQGAIKPSAEYLAKKQRMTG